MLILGSGTLAQSLLGAGLIDELRLAVNPVSLGAGTRFFPEDGVRRRFALTGTRVFGNGAVLLTYGKAG